MPLENIEQPNIININNNLRLRKYDGHFEKALIGYLDPYVYKNSEGIVDDSKKPDLDYVKGMMEWLNNNGELYFIEVLENNIYIEIGDVTVKDQNPPIAIWYEKYRGIGIGTLVMKEVIKRLKCLGYAKIVGTTIYKYNTKSQNMHERLGFKRVAETDDEYIYELDL